MMYIKKTETFTKKEGRKQKESAVLMGGEKKERQNYCIKMKKATRLYEIRRLLPWYQQNFSFPYTHTHEPFLTE